MLSKKSIVIKKKHKKKKIPASSNILCPVVKPELFDGSSNWLKIQKLIAKNKSDENSSKPKKGDQSSKSYKKYKHSINYVNRMSAKQSASQCSTVENYSSKTFIGTTETAFESNITCVNKCKKMPSKMEFNSVSSLKDESMHRTPPRSHNQCSDGKSNVNSLKSSVNSKSDGQINHCIQNTSEEKRITKAVAMDCEMVGTGPKGADSIIARVSIVNSYGECLYDEFVKPRERVTDYRTSVSGVRPSDLKKGKELYDVQKDVLNIIEGRILVGHSLKHDLDVLFISHPKILIRDTSNYKPFREIFNGRTPALKKLTSKILGCEIQDGEHSSVEDAQAAMLLYLRNKSEWEKSLRQKRKSNKRS